jgi:hypothetical protein
VAGISNTVVEAVAAGRSRGRSDGAAKVEWDRLRQVRDVEITARDGEDHGFTLIDAECEVVPVEEAEHARCCPRETLVPVNQRAVARQRVHQRGGLLG